MKCPYCNHEMRSGYIRNSTQPIDWIPDGEKPSVWKGAHAPEGVPLQGEGSYWKGYRATVCYCAHCKVVVARTEK